MPLDWLLILVALAVLYAAGKAVVRVVRRRGRSRWENADSEQWFRSLFEDSPMACHEIDRTGQVRRVNSRECGLRGMTATEMLERHCTDLVPEPERDRYWESVRQKLNEDLALVPYQRTFRHPDGRMVTL